MPHYSETLPSFDNYGNSSEHSELTNYDEQHNYKSKLSSSSCSDKLRAIKTTTTPYHYTSQQSNHQQSLKQLDYTRHL